jgi:hypothetical protein
MKMIVFWDTALCSLIEIDVSKVLTASIIRVLSMQLIQLATSMRHKTAIFKNCPIFMVHYYAFAQEV